MYIYLQKIKDMKKLVVILLSSLFVLSCTQEEVIRDRSLDTVKLRPDMSAWNTPSAIGLRSAPITEHLSPIQIVNLTTAMRLTYNGIEGTRGFDTLQRDTVIPCLKMWATDIIDMDGNLHPDFIESYNCLLEIWETPSAFSRKDTIGYIPNSVLRAAEAAIKAAYAANDDEEVYRLFNEAFTFRPVTGEEYRALMRDSLN